MTDKLSESFQKLRDYEVDLGVPSSGHFNAHLRDRILTSVRQQPQISRSLLNNRQWLSIGATVAAVTVLCTSYFWWEAQGTRGTANQLPPLRPSDQAQTYKIFSPPTGMHVKSTFPAPFGDVKVVTYTETPTSSQGPQIPDDTYVIATLHGVDYTLYHEPVAPIGVGKPAYWQRDGNSLYVTLNTSTMVGGLQFTILKLTPQYGSWKTQTVVQRDGKHSIPYGAATDTGSRVLTYSLMMGADEPPTWYDFTSDGVKITPVTENWPDPSTIPHSFVYNFTAFTSPLKQINQGDPTEAVNVKGETTPIHLRVGDTLVVEEQGGRVPMLVSINAAEPQTYDSLVRVAESIQWIPSPYRQTIMFKVTKPFHGALYLTEDISGTRKVRQDGVASVPIDVMQ